VSGTRRILFLLSKYRKICKLYCSRREDVTLGFFSGFWGCQPKTIGKITRLVLLLWKFVFVVLFQLWSSGSNVPSPSSSLPFSLRRKVLRQTHTNRWFVDLRKSHFCQLNKIKLWRPFPVIYQVPLPLFTFLSFLPPHISLITRVQPDFFSVLITERGRNKVTSCGLSKLWVVQGEVHLVVSQQFLMKPSTVVYL
jgi:hypothetical protein